MDPYTKHSIKGFECFCIIWFMDEIPALNSVSTSEVNSGYVFAAIRIDESERFFSTAVSTSKG